MSPMMLRDMETLTKEFAGGIFVPTHLCIKNQITSIPKFISFLDKMSGNEFFDAYDETYMLDSLKEDNKAYLEELKNRLSQTEPPGKLKLFNELKKYSDETKNRLVNFFTYYYDNFYSQVEEETTLFMKKRTLTYRSINESDEKYFLSNVLLINVKKLNPKIEEIVMYPSYFYEIGWSHLRQDNSISYIFGYILEQQLEENFMKKRCAEFRKILADDKRVEILKLLNKGEYYSAEIAKIFDLTKPTVSYHINKMIGIGILNIEFEPSNKVYLSLNKKVLKELLDAVYKDITENDPNLSI